MLILLYMFNPVVTSLRGLQQASDLKKVQKKLGCVRASLGSLSESVAVFDSQRLKPIIESLGEKLVPIAADKRLKDIQQTLTLVDGSIVEALPRIAMASFRDAQSGSGKKLKWTLHTHFEVDRSIPTRMEVTPTAGGEHDERAVIDRMVESDRTYVMDRGYAKFELFNRIATNLLEVPADIIALLYHYRWQIEIFFRFFKHLLGCRHLLSHSQNGIEVQVYYAIIACMLISLWTGRKPTLRTHEMICWYFCGMADEEELLAHLAKLHKPAEPRKPLI